MTTGWQLPTPRQHRDPRRVGLATGAVVIGYAIFVGAIRAGIVPVAGSGSGDVGPSDADLAALSLTLALALPGVIAGIGAVRRSGALLVAAGILCLGQAFLAFSGVTLPFVAPGIYLIALGAGTAPSRHPAREVLASIGALVLVAAGWAAMLGLTETRCWVATQGAGGELVYAEVPTSAAEGVVLDETQVAAGCEGGSPTTVGLTLSFVLVAVAVALAAWGARPDAAVGPPTPDLRDR
jgi:hypothetical protein